MLTMRFGPIHLCEDTSRSPAVSESELVSVLLCLFNSFHDRWLDDDADNGADVWEVTHDHQRQPEADAVVFHVPTLVRPLEIEKPAGQCWVAFSMESTVTVPELRDPAFLANFDLTMTYERSADVWMPYLTPSVAADLLTPPQPKDAAWPVARVQSNHYDRSGRNAYAAAIMSRIKVASYGTVLPTVSDAGSIRDRRAKLDVYARHKFTLAFENSIAPDYVTEKLYEPLIAGSVPVYLGAPNAAEFAPAPEAVIDVNQFSGPDEVAKYLDHLSRRPDEYAERLAWKQAGFSSGFRRLLEDALQPRPLHRLAELVRRRRDGAPSVAAPSRRVRR